MVPKICSIEGCGGRHEARGWCAKHYTRWRKHGDPFYTPERWTSNGVDKTCTKCGETKPLSEFNKETKNRDGLRSYCKVCHRAYTRKHAAENPEVIRAYKARNAELIRAKASAHYARNSEYYSRYRAKYYAANRHVYWETTYRTRMRKFGFEPVIRSFTLDDLIEKYGDQCHHCGGPHEELDHFPIPVGLGGEHSLDNCVPSCEKCNRVDGWEIHHKRMEMLNQ